MSRPATISPSQMDRLMAKRGLGKGAKTYADELILKAKGIEEDDYISYDMEWGIINEPEAVRAYEEKYLVTVKPKRRARHPKYRFISGETDGRVGENGLIEVKCPKSKYHLRNIRTAEQADKYYSQIQGYLWIEGRLWCDFVSYDPRFPEDEELAVKRIYRDQDYIDLLEERCIEFWQLFRDQYREDMGYSTKVTQDEAELIRELYSNTDYTMKSFALEFGVSVSTISQIVNHKIYTNGN